MNYTDNSTPTYPTCKSDTLPLPINIRLCHRTSRLVTKSLSDQTVSTLFNHQKKLTEKFLGPFEILAQVGSISFTLCLLNSMCSIHPVFHVSMLEPSAHNKFPNWTETPPLPIIINREMEFEISEILDSKIDKHCKCKLQYLVWLWGYWWRNLVDPCLNSNMWQSPWQTFILQTQTSQALPLFLKSILIFKNSRYFSFFKISILIQVFSTYSAPSTHSSNSSTSPNSLTSPDSSFSLNSISLHPLPSNVWLIHHKLLTRMWWRSYTFSAMASSTETRWLLRCHSTSVTLAPSWRALSPSHLHFNSAFSSKSPPHPPSSTSPPPTGSQISCKVFWVVSSANNSVHVCLGPRGTMSCRQCTTCSSSWEWLFPGPPQSP